MKPLLLKIRGLNSFEEEQVIDFDKLTSKGLFGIFGSTGSGKSTIIDAITMALYGQISRFDGDKSKQCINTNCDTMHLSLVFKVIDKIYTVERSYKKNGNSILSTTARLYEKADNIENVLADKTSIVNSKIEDLIGLNYKDFSRSVVLPQGKFSDFLLLINKERSNMLERIFHLEKYGEVLYRKIKDELKAINLKINIIDNNISVFGEISKEILEREKALLTKELQELGELNSQLKESQILLKKYSQLQEIKNEYEEYKKKQLELLEKATDIELKKDRLEKAKKADLVIPFSTSLNDTNEKISIIQKQIKEIKNFFLEIEKRHTTLKEKYENSKKLKEERYTVLLEKETSLKQAVQVCEQTEALEKERKSLQEQYKTQKGKFVILNNEKTNLEKEKAKITLELENILVLKNKINISSEIREKSVEGFKIWSKNKELSERYTTLKEKYYKEHENNGQYKIEINKNKENIIELNKKYAKIEQFIKENYEKNIITQDDLINFQQSLLEEKNSYKIKCEKNEELKEIKKQVYSLSKLINEKATNLDNDKNKLADSESELSKLLDEIEQLKIKNLAFNISEGLEENSPCPVCGSKSHPKLAEPVDLLAINSLMDKKEIIIKQNNILFESITNDSIKLASLKSDREKLVIQQDSIEKELCNINLDEENNKIAERTKEFENINNNIKKFENDKKSKEIELQNLNNTINEINLKIAGLTERILNSDKFLNESKIELDSMEKSIKQNEHLLNDIVQILGRDDFEAYTIEIKNNDKKREELEKNEEKARSIIQTITNDIEVKATEILVIEKGMEKIVVVGNEKKEEIERQKQIISSFSYNKEPKTYILEVQKEIKEINNNFEKNKAEFEVIDKELKNVSEKALELEAKEKILLSLQSEQTEKLNLICKENDITTVQVSEYFLKQDIQKVYENEVLLYNNEFKNINSNIMRLHDKIKEEDIEKIDEKVNNLNIKILEIDKNIVQKNKQSAIIKVRVDKMSEDLNKTALLLDEKKSLTYRASIVEDLAVLFEGKKFIEYIAKRHLGYITSEASSRLKDMTSGRYALELDETDFIIRDDFNGGIRRSPRTLSGGETFMTSLCLALALSSKIQLKSNAPLEFFFLDEGFGTLDPMLLDVVMNCLEQLQTEKMSVGLISHVEELKSRVPIKLIVTSAEQGVHGTKTVIQ